MPTIQPHRPIWRRQNRFGLLMLGYVALMIAAVGFDHWALACPVLLLGALGLAVFIRRGPVYSRMAETCPRCGAATTPAGSSRKRTELRLCARCDVLWDTGIRDSHETQA